MSLYIILRQKSFALTTSHTQFCFYFYVSVGLLVCLFGNFLFAMAAKPDLTRSISEFSTDLYSVSSMPKEPRCLTYTLNMRIENDFQAATEGKTSNVILSPFSVHMAVSLALMGARGRTSQEMLRGLKLSGENNEIADAIHEVIEPIQNNSMLQVANKVYVMQNYVINSEFNTIAKVSTTRSKISSSPDRPTSILFANLF